MRHVFTSILILLSLACFAQKEHKVMEWKTGYALNTYLIQQMKQQYIARNAMLALHTGRSLIAQRAADIFTVLADLKQNVKVKVPVELHATLADSSITRVYSRVIPGVLKYYNIPDLVKLIGEDKVIFVK